MKGNEEEKNNYVKYKHNRLAYQEKACIPDGSISENFHGYSIIEMF
jgi:hypothetical protein